MIKKILITLLLCVHAAYATTILKTATPTASKTITPHPEKAVSIVSRFGIPKDEYMQLVNQNAPKGGTFRLATTGTFDVVNDKIVKGIGTCALGIPLTLESLMMRSPTDPFAYYGLVAEKIEIPDDKSYVIFYINPKARFHNGDAVTTADIQATMETLRDKGLPRYKKFYDRISKATIHSPLIIQFEFKPDDRGLYDPEMPFIIGFMPVLAKKQLDQIDFSNSGLTPLVSTGPYIIDQIQQGRYISFKRTPNYWAADLPIMKGQYNFDTIRIEYFKNATAYFQAFLAKEFDIFFELDPKQWERGYNVDAVKNGSIIREDLRHERNVAVRTIIMNMRRPVFQNIELRRAILMAFDADSLNRMVFDGVMNVPSSLFANTEYAHQGPAEGREKEILMKYASQIEPTLLKRIIAEPFSPARTNGAGDQRDNLKKAANILDAAGYTIKNGKRHTPDGTPVQLSIMIKDDRLEKIALSLRESLKTIGIDLTVRKFDSNTYENKVVESDFDMIIHTWANTLSPGVEQTYLFSRSTADIKGSANYIGLKDPVAEALSYEVTYANTFDELKAAVRAMDRYVMHLCLQIPLAYDNTLRFAYWKDRLAIPAVLKQFDINVMNRGWDPKLDTTQTKSVTEASKEGTQEIIASADKKIPCGIICKIKKWFS